MVPPFYLDDPSIATPDPFGDNDAIGPYKKGTGDELDDGSIHGSPSDGYTRRALMLSGHEAAANESAMEYLRTALNNSAEITPTQGIAAALLAAVPTLGGYMIGKSLGTSQIPKGVFGVGKLAPTGGGAGGLLGVEAGVGAATDYLGQIQKESDKKPDILEKMATIKSREADRLGAEANTVTNAGLAIDANIATLPIKEAYNIRTHGAETAQSLASQKEMHDYEVAHPKPSDLAEARAMNAETNAKRLEARLTGNEPLSPSQTVMTKVASADAVAQGQERLRQLYNAAIQQLGPGFVQSFARKGLAALPANAQQEFKSTLLSVAMQMNKAVDPTPSDAGMQAQFTKLLGSVENGHFLEALDFEVKNARRTALAELEPFTIGPNPNAQVAAMKNEYAKKWGLDGPSVSDIDKEIADIHAALSGMK